MYIYKFYLLFGKILLRAYNSCVVPDFASIPQCQQNYQQIFLILLNQIFQPEGHRNPVPRLLEILHLRIFNKPLPVRASHLKGNAGNHLPVGINFQTDSSPLQKRRNALPHLAHLHCLRIPVHFINQKPVIIHGNYRISRLPHLHGHIRRSLVHEFICNKQSHKKNTAYYDSLDNRSLHTTPIYLPSDARMQASVFSESVPVHNLCNRTALCILSYDYILLISGRNHNQKFCKLEDGEKDARTKAYDPPRASPCHSKTSAPLSCYYASSCKSHNKPVSAPNPPAISTFPPGTPRPDYFLCLLF